MKRSMVYLVGAILSLWITADVSAQPTFPVVQAASQSIFHVYASGCAAGGLPTPDRLATGFAVMAGGSVQLVTALHAVAGCSSWQIQYQTHPFSTSVAKIYRTSDLALLAKPAGLSLPPLTLGTAPPSPGQVLEALGYGATPTLNPSRVYVRMGGANRIVDLVKSQAVITSLQTQGFPDVTAPIINLDAALTPGDSGAPLIDNSGGVVGVANGNLMEGTLPYSWAFPSATINDLLASTDHSLPSSSGGINVLVSEEEVVLGGGAPSSRTVASNQITCGVSTFSFRGTQTFARLVATADPFSAGHLQTVQNYATANSRTITPTTRFDVYVDSSSGADFVVPSGFKIHTSGSDCLATDPARRLEIRISSDSAPSFAMTGLLANTFSTRMVRPGEFPQPNPPFITGPVSRYDGMFVQRYAFFYPTPGQMPPYNEGYITFAWKGSTMLEVAVRTLVPALATMSEPNLFPSVASVYASTFTL